MFTHQSLKHLSSLCNLKQCLSHLHFQQCYTKLSSIHVVDLFCVLQPENLLDVDDSMKSLKQFTNTT